MFSSLPFAGQEAYLIHIEDIEIQHRRLQQLIKHNFEASHEPVRLRTVQELFTQLLHYSMLHFADEEQFMAECGYPENLLALHRHAHTHFLEMLSAENQKVLSGDLSHLRQCSEEIREWFEVHEQNEDRSYMESFAAATLHTATS